MTLRSTTTTSLGNCIKLKNYQHGVFECFRESLQYTRENYGLDFDSAFIRIYDFFSNVKILFFLRTPVYFFTDENIKPPERTVSRNITTPILFPSFCNKQVFTRRCTALMQYASSSSLQNIFTLFAFYFRSFLYLYSRVECNYT